MDSSSYDELSFLYINNVVSGENPIDDFMLSLDLFQIGTVTSPSQLPWGDYHMYFPKPRVSPKQTVLSPYSAEMLSAHHSRAR